MGEALEKYSGRDGDSQNIETAPVLSLPTSSPQVQGELSFVEPPSPARTRSYGKAKKTKVRGAFYKGFSKGGGVMYLPGDINGLAKKLQLLAASNTTVRNELVHELDALLRLKQLTRKEYTNITAHLAA